MRTLSKALAALPFGVALVLGLGACSDTAAATTYTPVTGIVVRAEPLTNGIGCGTADGQVFKYAAVVEDVDGAFVTGGVYDCFADAVLLNLHRVAAASGAVDNPNFVVGVFAYDQKTYTTTPPPADLSQFTAAGADGGAPAVATAVTYSTSCTVIEQIDVQAAAACGTLSRP